ncbi:hypothetical protein MXM82_04460 [Pseudomonas asiatica]|uniref:hypothetical protein n=1 Tax=Pseudomonas asiatica TaxID=2219225 RepID=UPI002DBAFF09|nr:hypothetical protein [Pseudomonas asiatica]MEB6588391.1 hypothetical protein [Pseudomonas asiatica]
MESSGSFTPAGLTKEHQDLRAWILAETPFYSLRSEQKTGAGAYDIEVGLALYRVLAVHGVNQRCAADDGLWRFLSLKLLPDLVADRWGGNAAARFWKGRSRIWLRAMWWMVHLTWQGSEDETRAVLRTVTTDTIMQLVERPGRAGFRVELTRSLFAERTLRKPSQSQFRAAMKLNTAKVLVVEPSLFVGGLAGYAKVLFTEAGCPEARCEREGGMK